MELTKEYQKGLRKLKGNELLNEIRNILNFIEAQPQRVRDRGSYLVLESLHALDLTVRGELINLLLKANPHPSLGVRSQLQRQQEALAKFNQDQLLVEYARALFFATNPQEVEDITQKLSELDRSLFYPIPTEAQDFFSRCQTGNLFSDKALIRALSVIPVEILTSMLGIDKFLGTLFIGFKIIDNPFNPGSIFWIFNSIFESIEKTPEEKPMLVLLIYAKLMELRNEIPEAFVRSIVITLLRQVGDIDMEGFGNRLRDEFHSLFDRVPALFQIQAGLDEVEREAKAALRILAERKHLWPDDRKQIKTAVSMVVASKATHLYGPLWNALAHFPDKEYLDLAALLSVSVGETQWQKLTLKKVLENDEWKKNEYAYDALAVLLRTLQVNDEKLVSEFYSTKRPHVLRLI